ncbi:MAG: phosphatase RsbU N-terminal domain-containing protein [Thermoanaerobaculia bacterium]
MSTKSLSYSVYHAALLDYMLGSGEPGLAHAYELGRSGFDAGCGLLHVLDVHERAVNTILESTPAGDEVRRRVYASTKFLAEAMSAFEMACRGYRAFLQAPGDK